MRIVNRFHPTDSSRQGLGLTGKERIDKMRTGGARRLAGRELGGLLRSFGGEEQSRHRGQHPGTSSEDRAGEEARDAGGLLAALLNEAKNALWPGPGRGRRIAESNEPLAGNSGKMRDQALKSVPRTWYED